MAGPMVLGAMSFAVMRFVDQLMVAQLGDEALAASGPAMMWSFLLAMGVVGIVGCVSTFVSQSFGRGEKTDCARYAWQGAYFSVVTGLLALALWPIGGVMFDWLGHEPEVARLESVYLRIRLLGYGFIACQSALTAFFQGIGRPKIPMYAGVFANALNVLLDYVLIFGKFGFPRWGIGGAAAGTVIALAVQFGILQAFFLSRRYDTEFHTRSTWTFDATRIGELLRIGTPSGLKGFIDMLSWTLFVSAVIANLGTTSLASHNAASNLMRFSFVPCFGLSFAATAIVGQWIGRGDIATAKARAYTATGLAVAYMFTMGVIVVLLGRPLIRLFSANPEIIRLGRILLVFAAVRQGFDAINIVLSGALRGAGDTLWMVLVFLPMGYLVFLPLATLLAYGLGLGVVGAWLAATVYVIAMCAILTRRFHGERWRHIRIFARDRESDGVGGVE